MISLIALLNEIKLYHGNKSGKRVTNPDFKAFPYFYLTDNYGYALYYAKGNKDAVSEFDINQSKLIDLRELKKYSSFKDFQQNFYKISKGIYFPSDLSRFGNCELWEYVRYDSKGSLAKVLKAKGFDGMIMNEQKDGRYFTSYVLFDLN